MILRFYRNPWIHLTLAILIALQTILILAPAKAADFPETPEISLSSTTEIEGYNLVNMVVYIIGGTAQFEAITDVKIFRNGVQDSTATISDIRVVNENFMFFTLGGGLPAGNYQFRFLTEINGDGYFVNFSIVQPSISLDITSIPVGYASSVTMTVTGTNTNFLTGSTSVAILDGGGTATGKAGTATITDATSLSFPVNTGLAAGTYTVRVTTPGAETVDATLTVRNSNIATLSPNSASVGYNAAIAVTVTGSSTTFSGASTVSILDSGGASASIAQNVTAVNGTSLTFNLQTGLAAGVYTVRVTTGNEVVTKTFTILTPSVALTEGGTAFASLTAGYATAKTITVTGTNTSFTNATTVTLKLGATDHSNKVSSITPSGATLTFSLATGLAAGTYTVTAATNGVTASANFNVVDATITSNLDSTTVAKDYKIAIPVQVTGVNTGFQLGVTTASIVNSTTSVSTGLASTISTVDTGAQTLAFTINTGLAAGTYKVCVTTNGVTSCSTSTFTVTASSASVTPSSLTGTFSNQSITVTGTNSHFESGKTTAVLQTSGGGSTTTTLTSPTVTSATQLSFTASTTSTLTPGTYKLVITTDSDTYLETITKDITITSSSMVITNTSVLKEGYTTAQFNVTGTNTAFDSTADGGVSTVTITGGASPITLDASAFSATSTTVGTVTIPTGLLSTSGNPKTAKTYTLTVDNASATFTVIPATSIAVTGTPATLEIAGTTQLTATATFSDSSTGAVTTGTGVVWASGDTNLATVSASGLVTAVASGTTNITATLNGTVGTFQVTILSAAVTVTLDLKMFLGNTNTSLNSTIRGKLNQTKVNEAAQKITIKLKTNAGDTGITKTFSDGIWISQSGSTAKLNGNLLVAKLSIANVSRSITIIEISGPGTRKLVISNINLNTSSALTAQDLYSGDLNGDGTITNADYMVWLSLYNKARMGTATLGELGMADMTMDGKVDNLDFSLWNASKIAIN